MMLQGSRLRSLAFDVITDGATPPAIEIWLAVHVDVRRDPDVVRVHDALELVFAREAARLAGGA